MKVTDNLPLVSIGIPTYNRARLLHRAVESVLTQDYRNIEVIISDDASDDDTESVCLELCRNDNRIRYIRQVERIGLTENYRVVLQESRGFYYMNMGDDDWLDGSYISECVALLREQPLLVAVAGKTRMVQGNTCLYEAVKDTVLQSSGPERVLAYHRQVKENGALYGIIRRDVLMTIPPMPNIKAGDIVYVGSIAFLGRIRTLETCSYYKSIGGVSSSRPRAAQLMRLRGMQGRLPAIGLCLVTFKDIAWYSPVYRPLGTIGRIWLAIRVALVMLLRAPEYAISRLARTTRIVVEQS